MGERPYVRNGELGLDWKASSKHLFNNKKVEGEVFENLKLNPIRPLKVISDFVTGPMKISSREDVVDQMAIDAVDQELNILANQCRENPSEFLKGIQNPDIALMDLLMVRTFYQVQLQLERGNPDLSLLVVALADHNGRIPQLTYEDLIFNNPMDDDPRSFFKGEIGESEMDFYRGHNLIEQRFEPLVHTLTDILEMCDRGIIDEKALALYIQLFKTNRKDLMMTLGKFHQISREGFMVFRTFFTEDEHKNRGASGAFSAGIPILDILIGLNVFELSNPGHLESVKKYYPRNGQRLISLAERRLLQNKSLKDYATEFNNDGLNELYETIATGVLRFRQSHAAVIKNVAPEIYNDEIPGTGNLPVKDFLLKHIEVNKEKVDEMKQNPSPQ